MQSPSAEELNAMTLQVGLVGSDGIVLASDRLVQVYENGSRSVTRTSKFLHGADALCCYSGDSVSEQTAYEIRDHDWSTVDSRDMEAVRSVLRDLGNAGYNKAQALYGVLPGIVRKVLAVHSDQLWLLTISAQNTSLANQVLDRAVAGDIENTSRYFMNKYANQCESSSVSELIRLAAYTILAAGEENPHGVGGLELYAIPTGKRSILLSAAQEQELGTWFKKTAAFIQKKFATPFNYLRQTPFEAYPGG